MPRAWSWYASARTASLVSSARAPIFASRQRRWRLMKSAVDIVVPMFALMLCGYLAVYFRILGAEGIKGLSNFVFFFAIPALLLRGISTSRGAEHDEIAIVYAYFLACRVVFAVAMAAE